MTTDTSTPRTTHIAVLVVIALTWLVSLLVLPWVPAQIPIHWGINGQPDSYASAFWGLIQLPLIATLVALLLRFIPRIDPKRTNYAAFASTYAFIQLIIVLFMAAVQGALIAIALGWQLDMTLIITLGIGLLFAALGNILGKLRPNWFAGIRTPWTLSSPDVWTKTHRLGGLLMVVVGIVQIIAAPLLPAPARIVLLLGSVLGWAAFTIGYSYVVWRKQQG